MKTSKSFLITVVALSSLLFGVPAVNAAIRLNPDERMAQFEKELKMTSEQKPKIKAVLEETESKLKAPTKPDERG